MSEKKLDDWIHGRLVVETDEPDIIIKLEPVEGGPTPTGRYIRFRPTPAQIKNWNLDGDPPCPEKLALELGLRRVLHIGKVVGGTALIAGAAMIVKGVPWTVALPAALATAAGSALVAGVKKTGKEIGKQDGAAPVRWWQILGGIIIEILKLVRELIRKEKR